MKKIICLLLAITCVFALISCSDKDAENFVKLVNESVPTKITTHTHFTYGSEEPLVGRFVTTVDGSKTTLEYEYQRNAIPGVDDSEDPVMTISGTVQYSDGKYSEDGGETWTAETPDAAAMQIKFNLDLKKLGKYELDGNTLTATLTSKNVFDVLGLTLEGVSDDGVTLTVNTNGTYLTAVTVSYTKVISENNSADVIIDTSYTYNSVNTPEENQ